MVGEVVDGNEADDARHRGVPLVGCQCPVCTSSNPKNKRLRASVLVESQGSTILIDSSPDLRQQALTHGITHLDAVLYTHAHADHTHGIDDMRSFNYLNNAAMPIYSNQPTLAILEDKFSYAFGTHQPGTSWYRPCFVPHEVKPLEAFTVAGIPILPFDQQHGNITSLGFRFGDIAYCTDVKLFPEASWQALAGVKCWVIDCLGYQPVPTHAHLELTLEWIARLKPERAILTHMSHVFDYDGLCRELPANVEPAYDGMVIEG